MYSIANTDASATAYPSHLTGFWKKLAEPTQGVSNTKRDGVLSKAGTRPIQPPATSAACHEALTDSNNLASDFFGAREAHRNATVSGPPPYAPYPPAVIETQPGVYVIQEPPTLARMLFIYGFLFFPFWLVGISILFIPLLPTEDWEFGKSEVEKAKLLRIHREAERKWACRCLIAMSSLIAAILLVAIVIKYGVMASV